MSNDIDTREYSTCAMSSLPVLIDSDGACVWKIDQKEYENRRDFRDEFVFSIDLKTSSRDLDDALHVKQLDDGNWQVGIHIADVSHFVNFGTELDVWAAQRATSVDLVHKVGRIQLFLFGN